MTSHALTENVLDRIQRASAVLSLPTIIRAHSFSVAKEMDLDLFAATFRIEVSSRNGLRRPKIRARGGAAAPAIDPRDQVHGDRDAITSIETFPEAARLHPEI